MTPTGNMIFIDTETTGLNTRLHDVIELAWAVNDGPIRTAVLPHTLEHADGAALSINKYYERGLNKRPMVDISACDDFTLDARGATVVAENYGFDVAMLAKKIGWEPWHHRKIELSTMAMMEFGDALPANLWRTAQKVRALGYEVPEPDHTAAGDVATLRACYIALREMRGQQPFASAA